jgi:hypothetical protein
MWVAAARPDPAGAGAIGRDDQPPLAGNQIPDRAQQLVGSERLGLDGLQSRHRLGRLDRHAGAGDPLQEGANNPVRRGFPFAAPPRA